MAWAEGLRHGQREASFARGVDLERLGWSNQPVLRDLETERERALVELGLTRQ